MVVVVQTSGRNHSLGLINRTWMRENLKGFSETFNDIKVETKYVANKHPVLFAEYSNRC